MRKTRVLQVASVLGVALFVLAACASAGTLTFNTNGAGTQFVSPTTGLTLNNSSGVAATLTFQADPNSTVGTPSNVNYGTYTLECDTCTTQAGGTGSAFSAFTFDLVINNVTDGVSGTFVGTSPGGSVFSDSSTIKITWTPGELTLGGAVFFINTTTRIVEPGSGSLQGSTTVQGDVNNTSSVPEPATFGLLGVSLVGLALAGRKRMGSK